MFEGSDIMYCRTQSFVINWSRGKSSFWVFQDRGCLFVLGIIITSGRVVGFEVL